MKLPDNIIAYIFDLARQMVMIEETEKEEDNLRLQKRILMFIGVEGYNLVKKRCNHSEYRLIKVIIVDFTESQLIYYQRYRKDQKTYYICNFQNNNCVWDIIPYIISPLRDKEAKIISDSIKNSKAIANDESILSSCCRLYL
jgi:hypothetical protein